MLITLAELPPDAKLTIACSRCPRRGLLSVARLIMQHGPTMPLRLAVQDINQDCPNRTAYALHNRCDVHFPGLAEML